MDPQQSGAQLGQLLFGKAEPTSYYRGQLLGAQTQNAMQKARRERALAIIAEGQQQAIPQLAGAASNLGFTPEQAAGFGTLGQAGGGNAQQLAAALGDLLELQQRRSAQQAALGGDLNTANANLMGVASGPVDLTKIAGGEQFNPLVTPGTTPTITTPGGLGDILASHALANERNASARLSNVKADAGGFNPNTGGKGGLPNASAVDAILVPEPDPNNPRAAPVVNPADRVKVLQWIAAHPGTKLGDYMRAAPVGSPGALPAAGAMDLGDIVTAGPAGTVMPATTRKVVRTGTAKDGRKVVQYDDGSIDYAD